MKQAFNLIVGKHERGSFGKDLEKALKALTQKEILVGVPQSKASRRKVSGPNNALLAYVHDNGSPLRGIPARPFMQPGIENAKKPIVGYMEQAGKAAMDGDSSKRDRALNAVGLTAQKSIRKRIQSNIPPPLAASTIRARKRKHKGRSNTSVTALIDTGQLLQSINYVIANKP